MTSTAIPAQRRVWHLLETLLAMSAGMLFLPPLESLFWSVPAERADLHALVMTCNMTTGMVGWMLVRRHRSLAMVGAMWAPLVLLAPLYHLGVLDGSTLLVGGHVLMLPCMFLAMRHRTSRSGQGRAGPRQRTARAAPPGMS